jgi:putative colanic acid biosynthesis UDP-glucose lipid carrier transferase
MQSGFIKQYHSFFTLIQELADVALIGLSLWLALLIRGQEWAYHYHVAFVSFSLCFYLIARYRGLYQSWRSQTFTQEAIVVIRTFMATLFILLMVAFALKSTEVYSRMVMVSWLLLCPLWLLSFRLLVRFYLRMKRTTGRNTRTVAIAGADSLAIALADSIEQSPWMGIHVSGFYDDLVNQGPVYKTSAGIEVPVIGSLEQLVIDAKTGTYDAIYIALPMRAENKIKALIDSLSDSSANIHYVPDIFTFNLMNSRMRQIGGIPTISVYDTPFDSFGAFMKRGLDVVLSTFILALIALPMMIIAAAIKIDSSGPAIFKQRRYGLNGDTFWVWKFRTMSSLDNGDTIHQASKNDERLTRLGSFLRRSSLDELPQFLNVMQGTMSIVGPRPHAVAHNEFYRQEIDEYMLRHIVKPGITGWAQINGLRGETDTAEKMEKRIEFDLHYIRNWSVNFDLKIIFLTFLKGFFNKNAY